MNINKSLDHFMAKSGMIQADLSRGDSRISPATISLIRNNHRSPRLETMILFADMFNVKLSEFIAAGE